VIIKCGQALTIDPFFLINWAKSRAAKLPRGSYWFYDSRVDPKEQARKWANWLSQDQGELMCWLDLEENYGGDWAGWQNWKIFLEEFIKQSGIRPDQIGIYTSYYYWIANAPIRRADLEWFGQFWLWIAWYTTNPANVLIPQPWTQAKLLFWQYGTMGVDGKTPNGKRYGAESIEIDENNFNGDVELYQQLLGLDTVVTPPPDGGTMRGTVNRNVTRSLNVRQADGTVIAALRYDFTLNKGDVVYGEVKADNRIYFSKFYSANGHVQNLGSVCSAVVKEGSTAWMDLADVQEPGTEPPPPPPPPVEKKIVKAVLHFDDNSTTELFPQ
jgi:hypothetical protein